MAAKKKEDLDLAMDVDWTRTPQEHRIRKKVQFTLSDDARFKLERLREKRGESSSAIVERLIMEAEG